MWQKQFLVWGEYDYKNKMRLFSEFQILWMCLWKTEGKNAIRILRHPTLLFHHVLVRSCSVFFRPPSQHDEVNQRRRRTNALLPCITIVFFVCWAPMVIFCFIYDFANHLIPSRGSVAQFTYDLTLLFGMLTPIGNVQLFKFG